MKPSSIAPNFSFSYCPVVGNVDAEEKEIMSRLLAYGCTPTGDKTTDKAHLRRIEEQKAKEDNYVSNKYLTVSLAECERIQEKKKANKKLLNNTDKSDKNCQIQDKRIGAETLGQQIYLAIQMKSEKDTKHSQENVKKVA